MEWSEASGQMSRSQFVESFFKHAKWFVFKMGDGVTSETPTHSSLIDKIVIS